MNIDRYLSETEKRTSQIVKVGNEPTRQILNIIAGIKWLRRNEKNKRIVRVILDNGFIVKLQSYDNGTPIIFVFEDKTRVLKTGLEILCESEGLDFSEINV